MTYKEIDIHQAKVMIDSGGVQLADIRDFRSYQMGRIPKAMHIQQSNVQEFLQTGNKNRPLICYCYHGHSSRSAANFFCQNGFREVYSLAGGFEAWRVAFAVDTQRDETQS